MKTKNSYLEYMAFNINSTFSLVVIIAIIVRLLKFLFTVDPSLLGYGRGGEGATDRTR